MQNNKRKGGGGRGGGANKKRFINKGPPSGAKSGIPLNSRGILVSCINSKEVMAAREAINLFTESYEELGGQWKRQRGAGAPPAADDAADDDAEAAPPTDIAAALASEVAELKDTSKQPFFYHLVGIHSVAYVEYKDSEGPLPSAIVQHACQRAEDTQQSRTRFCSRFYPIEHTCYSSMEKIQELAKKVVEQHFPEGAQEAIEFAVQYDARAAPQLDRMEVINAFANLVPKPHKVNLTNAHKTILVNVVKGTCGVAVVHKFKELCRYNIQTCATPEEERERQRLLQQQHAGQPKAAAAAAPAAPAAQETAEEQQKEGEAGAPQAEGEADPLQLEEQAKEVEQQQETQAVEAP